MRRFIVGWALAVVAGASENDALMWKDERGGSFGKFLNSDGSWSKCSVGWGSEVCASMFRLKNDATLRVYVRNRQSGPIDWLPEESALEVDGKRYSPTPRDKFVSRGRGGARVATALSVLGNNRHATVQNSDGSSSTITMRDNAAGAARAKAAQDGQFDRENWAALIYASPQTIAARAYANGLLEFTKLPKGCGPTTVNIVLSARSFQFPFDGCVKK